jgi:sigma-B regulation protein RsbU (phosphoserine phosphatase)
MLIGNELNGYTDTIESRKLILRTTSRAAIGFENAKLYQNAQRESLQREALFEVGKRISSSLNLAQVLDLIITELKQVVPYDAAGIFLIHKGSQEIDFENLQGVDPDKMDRVKLRLGQGIVGDVAKTGRPEIVGDVHKDPRYIEVRSKTRSEMVVPLMQDNEVVGLFALESDEPDAYSKKDLNLAQAFASQAAIAIENARLYQDSKRMRRLENELLVASKIQRALLPKAPPKIAGISISATNQPCLTMGGDLFDLIKFNDKHLGLAIGDVVGKGTQAAMLMAVLYAGFRSQVRMQYQPSEVVAKLNLLICESTAEGKYASFFYGMIDTGKKTITYTNAGHNAPIVFKNNGEFHNLQVGGTVLGFLENASFEQTTLSLHSGDVIVFYTDGITETFNEQEELYGEQGYITW